MTDEPPDTPLTKAEIRLHRAELQRVDATKVRTELEAARQAQDAKTIRLRALRLAKEASDREAASLIVEQPRRKAKPAARKAAARGRTAIVSSA